MLTNYAFNPCTIETKLLLLANQLCHKPCATVSGSYCCWQTNHAIKPCAFQVPTSVGKLIMQLNRVRLFQVTTSIGKPIIQLNHVRLFQVATGSTQVRCPSRPSVQGCSPCCGPPSNWTRGSASRWRRSLPPSTSSTTTSTSVIRQPTSSSAGE